MIDIHCHILPAIDDGPKSLEDSIALLELSRREGVTTVVATPHIFDPRYPNPTQEQIEERLDQVRQVADGRLQIVCGAEVRLTPEVLGVLERRELFINRGRYLLVELPAAHLPVGIENLLFQLMSAGVRPIIAHPERNRSLTRNPERLRELIRMGCTGQLDAPYLLGSHGSDFKKMVIGWIRQGLIHFVASDAHRPNWRAPRLAEPYEAARRELGEEIAQALFVENPRAAVNDEELPYRPDLEPEPARMGWFREWFGAGRRPS